MNIQFHLTNACNLRCKHCYQGEYNPETISLLDFKNILEKTKVFFDSIGDPVYAINITGGEPMCVPDIGQYLLEADNYCKRIGLLSNGLLLTENVLNELKKAKHFDRVQVSLEGPEDVNDMIRGAGTYKKIKQSILYIKNSGLRATVSCTIAPYNYNRIIELYDDLAKNEKPNILWFDRCIPFKGTDVLTKEQFRQFIVNLGILCKKSNEEGLFTKPLANRAMQWLAGDTGEPRYVCGAGLKHFTIMHNGDVMLCRRLNFSVGNLLKENWSDILAKALPIMKEMRKLPDECRKCDFNNSCCGGLKCLTYSLYKDFNHKDVNCYLEEH